MARVLQGQRRVLISRWLFTAIISSLVLLYGFYWAYQDNQRQALAKHKSEQLADAKLATQLIEARLKSVLVQLKHMASDPAVIEMNESGRERLRAGFMPETTWMTALTRVSADMRIMYTTPDESSIGADLSQQAHNQLIAREHEPVVSTPFRAVQGFQTIAVAYPVFSGTEYAGCMSMLLNFAKFAGEQLDPIAARTKTEVFVVDGNGVIIYPSQAAQVGQSCWEIYQNNPGMLDLAQRMAGGEEGTLVLEKGWSSSEYYAKQRGIASYTCARFTNTDLWSVCVIAGEKDVIAMAPVSRWPYVLAALFAFIVCTTAISVWRLSARHQDLLEQEVAVRTAELEEQSAQYQSLMEESQEPIVVVQDGRFVFANAAFSRLLGYGRQDALIGRELASVFAPADREMVLKHYKGRLAGQPVPSRYEIHILRADDEERWVEVNARVRRYNGRPAVQAALHDINDRKEAEEEVRRLNIELEQRVALRTSELEAANEILRGEVADRKRAEEQISQLNEELTATNEELNALVQELTATQEELRALNEELERRVEERTAELQGSEARIRAMLEAIPDLMFRINAEGVFTDCWAAEEGALLVPPSQLIDMRVAELLPPEVTELTLSALRSVLASGEMAVFEYTLPVHGEVWVEEARMVLAAENEVLVMVRNITEQKRAQDELRRSEEQYRSTIDSLADPLHVVDREMRVLLHNAELLRWHEEMGLASEIEGQNLFELYPFLSATIKQEYESVFNSKQLLVTEEETSVDEQRRVTETRKIPVIADGEVTRVITVLRDITERRRTAELTVLQRDLSVALGSATAMESAYQACLDAAIAATEMDSGGFYLRNQTTGALKLVHSIGLSPGFVERVTQFSAGSPHAELAVSKESYLGSVSEMPVQLTQDEQSEGLRAIGLVPIVHEGQAIAYLVVTSHTLSELPPHAQSALEVIAARTASVIARIRAEEALAYERDLFHKLMDNVPDTVYFKDLESRFTTINAAQADMLGAAEPEQAIGSTDQDYFAPAYAKKTRADELQIINSGQPLVGEIERVELADKQERWFSTNKLPLLDERGDIIGTFGISRDITELKNAEEELVQVNEELRATNEELDTAYHELQESEERYRALADATFAGTIIHDQGKVLEVNLAMQEMTGYERQELMGIQLKDIVAAEDFALVDRRIAKPEDTPFELRCQRRDGSKFVVEARSRDFPYRGQQVRVVSLHDITERKRAEQVQRTLLNVAEAASTTDNLAELLVRVRQELSQLLDTTNFFVALHSEESGLYSFPYAIDTHDSEYEPQALSGSLTDYVRHTGQPLLVMDKEGFSKLRDEGIETVGTMPYSWLGVPLKTVHGVIGVLAVQSYSGELRYTPQDENVLMLVSGSVALAVERKHTEDALRASEERYRNLFNNSPVGIYRTTPAGRVLLANPALCEILRYPSLSALYRRDLNRDGYEPGYSREQFKEAVEKEGEVRGLESVWLRSDGTSAVVRESARAVRDAEGVILYYEGTVEDITDRVQAEQALRASEERYRAFVSQSSEAIWCIEFEPAIDSSLPIEKQLDLVYEGGYLVECNDAMARMYGYDKAEELMGARLDQMMVRSDPANVEYLLSIMRSGYRITDAESHEIDREGNDRFYLNNVVGVIEDGRVVRAWGTQRDITERKAAEDALRASEERYRTLIESMSEGIAIADQNECFLFANPAAEKLFGVEAGGLVGRSFKEFTGARAFKRVAAATAEHQVGKSSNYEITITRGDGEKREVYIASSPLWEQDGTFVGSFGLVQDITELKKAETALRESEERYRKLVELAPVGIVIHCEGVVLFANPTAAAGFGIDTADDLIGIEVVDVFREEDREEILERIRILEQEQRRVPPAEHQIIRADGSEIDVEIMSAPLVYKGRNAILTVLADVTERKRIQEHILKEEKEESIVALAGGIAHDFNNILMGVLGSATLLKESLVVTDPRAELVGTIITSAERMSDLTGKLLAYARGGRYQPQPVEVNTAIVDSLAMIRGTIPSNVEVQPKLDSELWPVQADPGQLHQVLLNLLMNGIEAMAEKGGALEIRTENWPRHKVWDGPPHIYKPPGDTVRIVVHDTGCGMDASTLSRVFEPFFSTKLQGRGLGLAAVSGIIHKHNGLIWAESQLGKGTTFYVHLPRSLVAAPAEAGVLEELLGGRGECILVVDDEEVVLTTARRILERYGYRVLSAINATDGLQLFAQNNQDVDLVIVDLQMPGMSGAELIAQMRQLAPELRALISSGFREETSLADIDEQSIAGVLQKPYGSRELVKAVRDVLETGSAPSA